VVRCGYVDVPRECSMDDIAAELDISANAVSQRIRRGSANLVSHALTVGTDVSETP
jgi:predicted DNA binding protein